MKKRSASRRRKAAYGQPSSCRIKKTEIKILKVDEETGDILTGGRFSIREKDTGTLIKEFTANGRAIVLTGLLIAGKTYELSEEEPPAGYSYSEGVTFTVPEESGLITVVMKDKKNRGLN